MTIKQKEQAHKELQRQVESQLSVVAVTLSRFKAAKYLARNAPYEDQEEHKSDVNSLRYELSHECAEYYRLYAKLTGKD